MANLTNTAPVSTIKSETTNFFNRFVISVGILIFFYTIFYGFMGAYFASVCVGIGAFIFTPLTLLIEKKEHHKTARAFFLVCCNFYIYGTSLGLNHVVNVENYSIPALMVALLIHDFEDLKHILFGASLPIITWIMTETLGVSILPPDWRFSPPYPHVFMAINFFGSFFLAGLFLTLFVKTIKKQRLTMISTAKMSSLGEMAGGIAHEINNPLGIIITKISQIKLKLSLGKLDNEKLISDLNKIESTTTRIGKIIKGLRSFSRNSDQDEYLDTSLKEIIDDTIELSNERLRNKNIELKLDIDPKYFIHCRATQIAQVLMNLISNSIDAIESIPSPWIKISASKKNHMIQITFTDCGLGIPPHIVEKMMQPFFTTKDIGKGTGLGLSISKGILDEHKGNFYYDSTSKNTCFILEIPGYLKSDQPQN